MSCKRHDARRDKNEKEIVDCLTCVGATVQRLSAKDVPDLLVGYRGFNYLMEVKHENAKLKPGQKEWHQCWNGQVMVVRTIDDALGKLGIKV